MSRATHADEIAEAVAVLRGGGLVAFPTETVYGLGADASLPAAVRRVFAVKGRPVDHPLIVHLAQASQLDAWASEVPPLARRLAAALWPGPLTLVLRKAAHVDAVVTGGLETLALRVPAHPLALALLREHGGGIAAPSANRFGRVSPTTAAHVREDLGDDVALVLDGGPCAVGIESTIVDLSRGDDGAAILRPGGVSAERLAAIVGRTLPVRDDAQVRTPGQLPSHYAPRARVLVVEPAALAHTLATLPSSRVGVIEAVAGIPAPRWHDGPPLRVELDPERDLAHQLYATLRQLDAAGCDVIVATLPPPAELGLAVADRLRRAAGPRDDA
ncbi:MAG: threonylcarbamoyl-AMP synthase [Nannocystaceae bacterium]|nr:threonylcarbamoyl-AMP synthase [Nannocystaceae bacterium]